MNTTRTVRTDRYISTRSQVALPRPAERPFDRYDRLGGLVHEYLQVA